MGFDFRRHGRFVVAFGIGLGVGAASFAFPASLGLRALYAANAFFLSYLVLMLRMAAAFKSADLKRRAAVEDEGMGVIIVIALASVGISLAAIVLLLNGPEGSSLPFRLMGLAAVPLGWGMVQVLLAFHYAHLFYRPEAGKPAGGLIFPETKAPQPWDFLYFSFGIGMTAQVSDVQVTSVGLRKLVTGHAVGSFFHNTVILALAVNAAMSLAG
ncbi:MAG: DUF1345 domain-containing protein [Cypionkella sp.]